MTIDDFNYYKDTDIRIWFYDTNNKPVFSGSDVVDMSLYGRTSQVDTTHILNGIKIPQGNHNLSLHLIPDPLNCTAERLPSPIVNVTNNGETTAKIGDPCSPDIQNHCGDDASCVSTTGSNIGKHICYAALTGLNEEKNPPPCLEGTDKNGQIIVGDTEERRSQIVRCTSISTAIGPLSTDPAGFIKSIFSLLLGVAGGIAVILIIVSGYRLMASQGNPEQVQGAREMLTSAIVGLLFIIFSFVILQVIGVDILKIPGFE